MADEGELFLRENCGPERDLRPRRRTEDGVNAKRARQPSRAPAALQVADPVGRIIHSARSSGSIALVAPESGFDVGRQIIEARPREDDWPGRQSDVPLGALGREGCQASRWNFSGK